ncbi:MAG: type I DNA topoisomerase [Clostridia bacterium]|nr:type I DNA topoisomerase [Clostridia bacterium]
MADNLVIVESPAKANTIKKYLGKNYKVIASMGHLVDLPKSQIGIDLENNFEPRYITIRGKGELLSKLKKEAKAAKKVYLATDPDREGEAISWHLLNALELDRKAKNRITFNEITKNAVKEGLKNPRILDENLVNAQQARRIVDRIVGYQISPLLWKNVKKGLSAGRVQSVATKIICDREKEIENFVTEEYWTLTAILEKDVKNGKFEARFYGKNGKKVDVTNEKKANLILESVKNDEFKVTEVKNGTKQRKPAPPFTTSTLQQEASKKLNFTTKRTMSVAQILYEGLEVKGFGTLGLITYMRTDSLRISKEAQEAARNYLSANYAPEFIPKTAPVYKAKGNAQDAHEAIRPANVEITPALAKASLKPEQYKLYKLIWERFVASQMTNAVYDTVSANLVSGGYDFKASGMKLKFAGFTKIYDESAETVKEQSVSIPLLKEGETVKTVDIDAKQNFTVPPSRYTEASLIKTMEENGIGRPSTYSPTISTILDRGYVVKEQKSLKPTELGEIVNSMMSKHFEDIVDVTFTANMEKQLDEIEEGREWTEIVNEFYNPFKAHLAKAESTMEKVEIKDEETDIVCEKCGRNMVIKSGRFGKFLACPGFPECRNTKTIAVETGVDCPLCRGKILIKKSQKGKKYYGCENFPECEFMLWDEPLNQSCPKCGSMVARNIFRGRRKLKCINENCDYEVAETNK